jgi:hypothetical protein
VDKDHTFNIYSLIKIILFFIVISLKFVFSQQVKLDTLHLKAGSQIEFINSVIDFSRDTVITVPSGSKYIIYDAPDSTSDNFYKKLNAYSKKNKLLKLLYKSIIVEKKKYKKATNNSKFNKSFVEYTLFSGKIIMKIRFIRVRLFSGSVYDTTDIADHKNEGIFEKVHIGTKDDVIAKYLTFNVGEELDPHRVSDSERILRRLSFIEDAKIFAFPNKNDTTKVDLVVVTKDRFSWGFNVTPYSFDRLSTTLYNRNVLGNGWNFELKYMYNGDFQPPNGIDTKIDFINIKGWFVDATLGYYFDAQREGERLYFSKPFVTVETKYGGGLDLENLHSYHNYGDTSYIPFTYNLEDLWMAHQFPLSNKDRNKTLFIAGRFGRKEYTNRPYISPDSNYYFYNANVALGSIIYSNIDYYKSLLIYGFGITEDIPVGTRIVLTAGIVYDDFYRYNYRGLSAGHSLINKKWGYTLLFFKWGALYDQRTFRHGWISLYGAYISPLIRRSKVNLRHFINVNYGQSFNQLRDFYLHLSDESNIRGLNLNSLNGIKRAYFSYEGVMFTPVNIFGFNVAMFGFADLAFISNDSKLFSGDKMYSGVGFGWRIKNESLVFSTIQIRLAYYPHTVSGGGRIGFDVQTKETRLFQNVFPVKPEVLDLR